MQEGKSPKYLEKSKELILKAAWVFVIALFVRLGLLLLHTIPGAALIFDAFMQVLEIPVIGTILQFLIIVFYASPADAFADLLFFSFVFYFSVFAIAGVVFPLGRWTTRFKVMSYLLRATLLRLPHPVIRASNGSFEIRGCDPKRALGPGIILCDGVTALALEKKDTFTRVVGPGLSFLEIEERVHAAIDLRPQSVRRKVSAVTREGIEVECDLLVRMEIRRGEEWSSDLARYPFDKNAAYQAIYAEHSKSSEPETAAANPHSAADWCETIGSLAEDHLRQIVASYTLDQVFAVDNPDRNPRQELGEVLTRSLSEYISRYGGAIGRASIGNIRPPRTVLEQRIRNWTVEWERRRRTVEALGDVQRHQIEESARAMAQGEMLQSLVGILAVSPEQTSLEVLSLRLIQALEQMAREPATGGQLDIGLVELLNRLGDLLHPTAPPNATT